MFAQKCGVTDRFSQNRTQTTPILGIALCARVGQVRHERPQGRRHGADDGVGGEKLALRRHAGDAAVHGLDGVTGASRRRVPPFS